MVSTVKVGRVSQPDEDIQKNIMAAVHGVLPHLLYEPGMNLACIRSLSLKLSNSMSLPFFVRLSQREVDAWKSQ